MTMPNRTPIEHYKVEDLCDPTAPECYGVIVEEFREDTIANLIYQFGKEELLFLGCRDFIPVESNMRHLDDKLHFPVGQWIYARGLNNVGNLELVGRRC
ncbi:hypothetical protein M3Y98_01023300 [Aphelenchoides besseyi]|nr:hypothetical protein M3Y98_01023300 [Aphelenchoides besseyi]